MQTTGIMDNKKPESPAPCVDCEGLRSGTRSLPQPHQYLVLTGQSEASGAATYRCLICRNELTREKEGNGNRWR